MSRIEHTCGGTPHIAYFDRQMLGFKHFEMIRDFGDILPKIRIRTKRGRGLTFWGRTVAKQYNIETQKREDRLVEVVICLPGFLITYQVR